MDDGDAHAERVFPWHSRRKYAMLGQPMKSPPGETGEREFLRSKSWRMLADTVTVSGWTAAVKVAGAAKVIISARLFGTGDVLAGPIDAALVPRLVELREGRGRAAIEEFSSNVLAVTGAVFLMAAVT